MDSIRSTLRLWVFWYLVSCSGSFADVSSTPNTIEFNHFSPLRFPGEGIFLSLIFLRRDFPDFCPVCYSLTCPGSTKGKWWHCDAASLGSNFQPSSPVLFLGMTHFFSIGASQHFANTSASLCIGHRQLVKTTSFILQRRFILC